MKEENYKNCNILITGGAGFIGSHLSEALIKLGANVWTIDNFCNYYDPKIKRKNVEQIKNTAKEFKKEFVCIEADIRNKDALSKVFQKESFDTIVHLAAMAGVRASIKQPELYKDVNINGTNNLLGEIAKNKIEKVVFGSSSSVYGESKEIPFKESQKEYITLSPYSSTKLEGEKLCIDHCKKYGTNMAMLRFFTVYGPRQRPDMAINKFVRLALEDKAIPFFGDGNMKRDYTYVADIVKGILGSIEWIDSIEVKGVCEPFNLASGRMITLNKLVHCIEKSLSKKIIKEQLETPKTEMPLTYGDITKAREAFGYGPDFMLERGVDNFIRWYKEIFLAD